jgi:hypothetical protein
VYLANFRVPRIARGVRVAVDPCALTGMTFDTLYVPVYNCRSFSPTGSAMVDSIPGSRDSKLRPKLRFVWLVSAPVARPGSVWRSAWIRW